MDEVEKPGGDPVKNKGSSTRAKNIYEENHIFLKKLVKIINPDDTYWNRDCQKIVMNKNEEELSFIYHFDTAFISINKISCEKNLLEEGYTGISCEDIISFLSGDIESLLASYKMGSKNSINRLIGEFLIEWERFFH